MATPPDHKTYLAQPFVPDVPLDGFSEADTTLLEKYGSWLKALMLRQIEPVTDEQRQFVQMCFGEASPGNELARIWKQYQLNVMYHVALKMEAQIADHDFPYRWIVERFRTLAEQGHQGARAWLHKEKLSFAPPKMPPLVDIARIYPDRYPKLDLMDAVRILPGSFESGSRR